MGLEPLEHGLELFTRLLGQFRLLQQFGLGHDLDQQGRVLRQVLLDPRARLFRLQLRRVAGVDQFGKKGPNLHHIGVGLALGRLASLSFGRLGFGRFHGRIHDLARPLFLVFVVGLEQRQAFGIQHLGVEVQLQAVENLKLRELTVHRLNRQVHHGFQGRPVEQPQPLGLPAGLDDLQRVSAQAGVVAQGLTGLGPRPRMAQRIQALGVNFGLDVLVH